MTKPSSHMSGPSRPSGPDVPPDEPLTDAEAAEEAHARRRHRLERFLQVAVFCAIVGAWELSAQTGLADPFFFGKPSGIAATIWRWATRGTPQGPLWQHVAVTLEETILAFGIGVLIGVVAGFALARNRTLATVLGPYVRMGNAIPRVILGSIFVIWLGLGMASKVALGVTLTFFVVFFNAFQGAREVDRNLMANARILGANNRRLTTEIVIPSAMSWIIASLHTSFGLALVGAVVGELFGATAGVGELIYSAEQNFDANGVFAGMVLLAAIALVAEALITALENRLVRWRPQVNTETRI